MRLIALRGANTVTENDRAAILAATDELMREILGRNALAAEDLVSCIFTLTPDLDAAVPRAWRRARWASRPCRCCARARSRCPGALPKVIRVLIHAYCRGTPAEHVYLGEAVKLRLDLQGAQ